MHFKVTLFRLIVSEFSELLGSEGALRSLPYTYPVT